MPEEITQLDINEVTANLSQLLTNSVNITDIFYDIFINPVPMDVTVHQYNSEGELITAVIPNRAKDRSNALRGNMNPEGVIEAVLGTVYVNTSNQVAYIKTTENGTVGWVRMNPEETSIIKEMFFISTGQSGVVIGHEVSNESLMLITKNGTVVDITEYSLDIDGVTITIDDILPGDTVEVTYFTNLTLTSGEIIGEAESWAIGTIEDRPEGSAKYWAERTSANSARVTTEENVSTIEITDVNGTTTAQVVSPIASITTEDGISTIEITDINGTSTTQVYNGGYPIASMSQAKEGINDEAIMTPLKTKVAIDNNTSIIKSIVQYTLNDGYKDIKGNSNLLSIGTNSVEFNVDDGSSFNLLTATFSKDTKTFDNLSGVSVLSIDNGDYNVFLTNNGNVELCVKYTRQSNEPTKPCIGDVWVDVSSTIPKMYKYVTDEWQEYDAVYCGRITVDTNEVVDIVQPTYWTIDDTKEDFDTVIDYTNLRGSNLVGDIIVTDGVASGFSSTGHITGSSEFAPQNGVTWKSIFKIKTGSLGLAKQVIRDGGSSAGYRLEIDTDNLLGLSLSGGGVTVGTHALEEDTNYIIKVEFNGTSYVVSISEDIELLEQNRIYIDDITIVDSTEIDPSVTLLGVNGSVSDPFLGNIDLKEAYTIYDDQLWEDYGIIRNLLLEDRVIKTDLIISQEIKLPNVIGNKHVNCMLDFSIESGCSVTLPSNVSMLNDSSVELTYTGRNKLIFDTVDNGNTWACVFATMEI